MLSQKSAAGRRISAHCDTQLAAIFTVCAVALALALTCTTISCGCGAITVRLHRCQVRAPTAVTLQGAVAEGTATEAPGAVVALSVSSNAEQFCGGYVPLMLRVVE